MILLAGQNRAVSGMYRCTCAASGKRVPNAAVNRNKSMCSSYQSGSLIRQGKIIGADLALSFSGVDLLKFRDRMASQRRYLVGLTFCFRLRGGTGTWMHCGEMDWGRRA